MNNIPILDVHQDIADSLLYTAQGDFFRENKLHEGQNNLGIPVNNQSDIVRLRKGRIKGVFAVACAFATDKKGNIIPCENHFTETLRQIKLYHELAKQSNGKVELVKDKKDVRKLLNPKLSFVLAIEGADCLAENPSNLDKFYDLGVRIISLTWNYKNKLAGGCHEKGSITRLGEKVLERMANLGIILDLAHINEESFYQALEIYDKKPIVSHAGCKSILDHPRNLSDNQIKGIAQKNGLIGICGVPKFVGQSLDDVVKHFMRAIEIAGIDHIIIGSDFGSMTAQKLIPDFYDVSCLPNLLKRLQQAGLSKSDIEKIAYKNLFKFLQKELNFKTPLS